VKTADERARDYAAIALQYAIDVVLPASIAACKWVIAACQRQLDDLERARDARLPLPLRARARRACVG
jgi:hypothetical protein